MSVRGLLIVVVAADRKRWEGALRLAAAQAALGARTRLFLDEAAVALLARPGGGELLDTALELGVELVACQSGLAAAGLDLARVEPRAAGGGLVSMLATLGEDRLATI